jgi:hypothetical protein
MERPQFGRSILQAQPADALPRCQAGAKPVEFLVWHGPLPRGPNDRQQSATLRRTRQEVDRIAQRGDAELPVDRQGQRVDRASIEPEHLGDLGEAEVFGEERKRLDLGAREAGLLQFFRTRKRVSRVIALRSDWSNVARRRPAHNDAGT